LRHLNGPTKKYKSKTNWCDEDYSSDDLARHATLVHNIGVKFFLKLHLNFEFEFTNKCTRFLLNLYSITQKKCWNCKSLRKEIKNLNLKTVCSHCVLYLAVLIYSTMATKISKWFLSKISTIYDYAGASPPPRQPRQLPWLIFETIINYKKWPKQLGRFEEKNIFIFLPSKKTL
jgi:hypothetical protein